MLEDEKLAIDESERAARHQAVKGQVRREVQGNIAREAARSESDQRGEAAAIGEHFREKAVGEIASTETEIERGRAAARVSQVVDYIFYLIYTLIALEIVLELLGALETNSFKRFMDALTALLLMQFNTLIPDLAKRCFLLKVLHLVALLVYVLLHFAINGLLRLLAHRKTVV